MQAIFPESVGGDLLRLVHLLNSFKIINSVHPFKVGNKCQSVAKILASPITIVARASLPLATCCTMARPSSKPALPSFTMAASQAMRTLCVDRPDCVVKLNDAPAVSILRSSGSTGTMTRSLFCLARSSVNVTGKVYACDQLKTLIPVTTVDYTNGVSVGNPVTAHPQCHGVAQDQPVLFNNANIHAAFTCHQ